MTDEDRAIALYVKDGGLVCEWHAIDALIRHGYRLAAIAERENTDPTLTCIRIQDCAPR
jgi:hypothetical protein